MADVNLGRVVGPAGARGEGVPAPAAADAGKVPTVNSEGTGYELKTPSGGGGRNDDPAELLVMYTVTEETAAAASFVFTSEEYPGIEDLTFIAVAIKKASSTNGGWCQLRVNNAQIASLFAGTWVTGYLTAIKVNGNWVTGALHSTNNAAEQYVPITASIGPTSLNAVQWASSRELSIVSYGAQFPEGTEIRIWGS